MGQKVRPTGFRIGVYDDWRSRWYAKKKDFGALLVEDQKIRDAVKAEYGFAGVPRVDIERKTEGGEVTVIIRTARPGVIIGRKGAKVDKLKDDLAKITSKNVDLKIIEIDRPELDAQLVAEGVAEQLKKRMSFRRVIKKSLELTMGAGAKGCRIQVSGRLGGHEMARTESSHEGSIPLQTLRADIDYGFALAITTHGSIGVKCWIYRGELREKKRASTYLQGVRNLADQVG
ncbi:MAG TPA: 30S ribosomal protein S3 [Planctomycetes bacterium]|nr:30S ribosomal protein S3 [Planctomycetota bacterium]|tara:strand:+ start:22 stop:714 length:693 start_codon:yes stop_codon:yes gene_type:complete